MFVYVFYWFGRVFIARTSATARPTVFCDKRSDGVASRARAFAIGAGTERFGFLVTRAHCQCFGFGGDTFAATSRCVYGLQFATDHSVRPF